MKMREADAYARKLWGDGSGSGMTIGRVQRNRRSPRFVVGYTYIETTGAGTQARHMTWSSDVDWESAFARAEGRLK